MKRSDAQLVAKVVAGIVREQRAQMRYRGQYSADADYVPGNFVSHEGNVWHCDGPAHGVAPAVGSELWTLAVKRGKDGGNG